MRRVRIVQKGLRDTGREGRASYLRDIDMWVVKFNDGRSPCAGLFMRQDMEILDVLVLRQGKNNVWQN